MEGWSNAEKLAANFQELPAFPVQLHEVRRKIKEILDLFGREHFFREYTVHSFYSHVESMLKSLDWLITAEAKQNMTYADWLIITLAIYMHDIGLIVTEEEYNNRDKSAFDEFCEKQLFSKDDGLDYKAKVLALGSERADRYLYQEFVRFNHARRVRAWVMGEFSPEFGHALQQHEEIGRLISNLALSFAPT